MKKLDPELLEEVRKVLEVKPDSKDPAIEWLANAVMIVIDLKGIELKEALDNEEPAFVYYALEEAKDTPTSKIAERLRIRLKEFQAAGGRGVELADKIDNLRSILVIRRKMKSAYSWPGPREWSPKE